jgi:two-component system nitrate/nitrite response regulator NarL
MAPGQPSLLLIDGTVGHSKSLADVNAFKKEIAGGLAVMLVESYELQNLVQAYEQNIDGYLTTSASQDVLVAYLALVMAGERMISSAALDVLRETAGLWHSADLDPEAEAPAPTKEPWDGVDRREHRGLSIREASILRCLMEGDSNKAIARKCDITESTVKVHIKSINRKIKAANRTQAALWATLHLDRVERRLRP